MFFEDIYKLSNVFSIFLFISTVWLVFPNRMLWPRHTYSYTNLGFGCMYLYVIWTHDLCFLWIYLKSVSWDIYFSSISISLNSLASELISTMSSAKHRWLSVDFYAFLKPIFLYKHSPRPKWTILGILHHLVELFILREFFL